MPLQEGYVVRRPAGRAATMDDARQHLLTCALDANGRFPPYVAIMRLADGLPKLLTRPALDALCIRLAAQLEAGAAAPEGAGGAQGPMPCMLQVGGHPVACRAPSRLGLVVGKAGEQRRESPC